jgi:hypothetical protein
MGGTVTLKLHPNLPVAGEKKCVFPFSAGIEKCRKKENDLSFKNSLFLKIHAIYILDRISVMKSDGEQYTGISPMDG